MDRVPPAWPLLPNSPPILFLINPHSGKANVAQLQQRIATLLGDCLNYVTHELEAEASSNSRLATEIAAGRYGVVIAAGGDGTVREVIALLAQHNPQIPFGILPLGTGNLLAKFYGIPEELDAAIRHLLQAQPVPCSIMKVNQTYGALVAGIGTDAEIMAGAPSQLKRTLGPLAYVLSAIQVLFRQQRSLFFLRCDRRRPLLRYGNGVLVIQRNQFARAFLPFDLVENDNEDILDICVITPRHPLRPLAIVEKLMTGDYAALPQDMTHYRAKQVRIRAFTRKPLQVDGDVIEGKDLQVQLLNNHLWVLASPHSRP
ncbi:MAG: diacylglycerol kinase family protein [Candidatus Melainabacteria bacterium]|nr:diacylglycerol kinase family protein [Candidatus Melainabacteria bacterium]